MATKTKAKKAETVESLTFDEHSGPPDVYTVEHEGFTVTACFESDDDADVSYIGEFSDKPGDGAIDHHEKGEWLERSHRGLRYFNPANYKDAVRYLRKYEKLDEEAARAQADRQAMEDYRRLVEYYQGYWSMLGMVVKVYLDGVELGDSSIWGVESDAGAAHFKELFEDQLHEAMDNEARKKLDKLVKTAKKLPKKEGK